MDKLRKRLLAASVILVVAVVSLAVSSLGFTLRATPFPPHLPIPVRIDADGDNGRGGQQDEISRADTETTNPISTVCMHHAPVAVMTYLTDSPERDKELERYFVKDAEGLEIPLEELDRSDAGMIGEGYMRVSVNDTFVACVVDMPSGASWDVVYEDIKVIGYRARTIRQRTVAPHRFEESNDEEQGTGSDAAGPEDPGGEETAGT